MADITITSVPLDSVVLDPRNEQDLVLQAQQRVYNASGGQLNDFTENSPVSALLEGFAFAGSELLYYINQLPTALVLQFLTITGVQRSLGTQAVATLTFNLAAPSSSSFLIPQGFEVVDASGNYSFFTDVDLTIPPGLTQGSVTATAEAVGSVYNLAAYTISGITQPYTNLAGVINTAPSEGGTDEETTDAAIARGLVQLRLKNLVSASDYEDAAIQILGDGSVAKAIGLLGADSITPQLGAVHLYLLNGNQQPANQAQILQVKTSLGSRIQVGTSLYVDPMVLLPVSVNLQGRLVTGKDPVEATDELWAALQDYLNPSTYELGQDIILSEVSYHLRLTSGIREIDYIDMNSQPLNIPLVNLYTLPYASSLFVQLVSDTGYTYQDLRGIGQSLDLGGE